LEAAGSPLVLSDPAAQSFVDGTFAEIVTLTSEPSVRGDFSALKTALHAPAQMDRTRVLAAYRIALLALLRALPSPRDRLLQIGMLAEQTQYNARVLRERAADLELRRQLGTLSDGDAVVAGLRPLRARLAALPPEDWDRSAGLAERIVAAALGPGNVPPFPAAPALWTVVLRARPAGSGPFARTAPHFSLDVVWYDGHHETFGGYPNGGLDFDHDAARIECLRNREPQTGVIRAIEVVPPAGKSYEAIAQSFESSCDAFGRETPPYSVSEASDDKFIAALLAAAGIDPASVLP
jgi:hypothetical protein